MKVEACSDSGDSSKKSEQHTTAREWGIGREDAWNKGNLVFQYLGKRQVSKRKLSKFLW